MGSLKSLALLALLISLFLTVLADEPNDATHAKDAVNPSETTDAIEPQQRWGGSGCRYGCCGPWHYGRCAYCCRRPQAETEVVEPQQRWGGGGGGCRYGCCGQWRYGHCSHCCRSPQAEAEVVEPQQRGEEGRS